MPKLPDASSLGPLPSVRSGRPIASYDTSAIGNAMARSGETLARAAAVLQAGWDAAAKGDAESRWLQFQQSETQNYNDTVKNTQAGQAQGFADSYLSGYKQRAKAFLDGLPADVRPEYGDKAFIHGDAILGNAQEFEHGEQKRFSLNSLDTTFRTAILPRADMAAKLPANDPNKATALSAIEADAKALIDKNPALTPIEKDQIWNGHTDQFGNWKPGVRENIQTGFAKALPDDEQYMLDPAHRLPSIPERIAQVESGGDPYASNKDSTAVGLGQFTKDTWLGVIRRYHPELAKGHSNEEILALRTDPQLSAEMIQRFTDENTAYLGGHHIDPSPGNLYLAHFLGAQGAVDMLTANPMAIAATVNPAAAKANPAVFYAPGDDGKPDMARPYTAAEVAGWAENLMAGTRRTNWSEQLDAIPFDSKVNMATDASARLVRLQAAQEAAAKAAHGQQFNDFMNGITDGTVGIDDISRAYAGGSGWLTDYDERKKALDAVQARDKDGLNLLAAEQMIGDRTRTINPFADADKKAVNLWYDKGAGQGGAGLLDEPDPPAGPDDRKPDPVQLLRAAVERTDMVPDSAVAALKGGMWSQDPKERDRAMTIMDGLARENPGAVNRAFTEDDLRRLDVYQNLAGILPADRLNEELDPFQTPQQQQARAAVEKQGKEIATKLVANDASVILNGFNNPGVIFNDYPAAPRDPLVLESMKADFVNLYGVAYSRVPDTDAAEKLALKWMQNKWGRSDVGSGSATLMAYPPERRYPVIAGNHDWMDEQLDAYVKSQIPDATDHGIIAMPRTESDFASNQYPHYWVWALDRDGAYHVLTGTDDQGLRFNPDAARAADDAALAERQRKATAPLAPGAAPFTAPLGAGETAPVSGFDQPLGAPPAGSFGGGGPKIPDVDE